MTSNATPPSPDRLNELNRALAHPALVELEGEPCQPVSDLAERAAYQVARALGNCQLFGVELSEELDGVLEERFAIAAARVLCRVLPRWIDDARSLGERFDSAEDFEDIELCADMLFCCMDAWAVFIALNEAARDYEEAGLSQDTEAARLLDEVGGLIDQLDDVLQEPENVAVLSTVVQSMRLLDNWRGELAQEYRDPFPWWLDGTLEEADKAVDRAIENDELLNRLWRASKAVAQPRPSVMRLLQAKHAKQIRYQSMPSMAASSGGVAEEETAELQAERCPIEGDSVVSVRLDTEMRSDRNPELRVFLVGRVVDVIRYSKVEIVFRGGSALPIALDGGFGTAVLADQSIDDITAMTIFDVGGRQLRIHLGEDENDG